MTVKLTFDPYDITIEVPEGENLLRAASDAGIHINASCGGEGVCGKCKILLESGELDTSRSGFLSEEAWNLGYRQACQCRLQSDAVIRVPPESLLDHRTLTRRRSGIALRPSRHRHRSPEGIRVLSSGFQKRFVKLAPPTLLDNLCDLSRLEQGLARQHALGTVTIDITCCGSLPR